MPVASMGKEAFSELVETQGYSLHSIWPQEPPSSRPQSCRPQGSPAPARLFSLHLFSHSVTSGCTIS